MSDRRYSTARWQRLRKAVLAHHGHTCQVEGLRCTGYATTVHHLIPSSQAPHLFCEPANLAAACGRCNYGDGARVAAENTRRTIEDLRALVIEQQEQIAELTTRLAHYGDQTPAKSRTPRSIDRPRTHNEAAVGFPSRSRESRRISFEPERSGVVQLDTASPTPNRTGRISRLSGTS